VNAPSSSLSFVTTFTSVVDASVVEAVSSFATGGSLTPVIVTVTVAVSVPPWPSEIVYVNESVSVWPVVRDSNWPFGSYVTSVPLLVTVPVVPVVSTPVTVRVWFSASVSFASTSTVSPVESSETLGVSSTASGASLMPLTVMVTVAESVAPLASVIVYVNVSVSVSPAARPSKEPFGS
jgi:hypothetical protein